MKIRPTDLQASRSSSRRCPDQTKSAQRYAGFPLRAARIPSRQAKNVVTAGCRKKRKAIGPCGRAPISDQKRINNSSKDMQLNPPSRSATMLVDGVHDCLEV